MTMPALALALAAVTATAAGQRAGAQGTTARRRPAASSVVPIASAIRDAQRATEALGALRGVDLSGALGASAAGLDALGPAHYALRALRDIGGVAEALDAADAADAAYAADAADAADVVDGARAGRLALAPPAWQADDPADSLYRRARATLSDGRYDAAAELFERIYERYPRSTYAADAPYWEAFARYRMGGDQELARALDALALQAKRYPRAATLRDARSLRVRIQGARARRGNSDASESLIQSAQDASSRCADEDDDPRIDALNALLQMDAESATPILKKVLARRDACSESLRKKAVFVISQKHGDETTSLLLGTARNDPSADVREQAVFWLSQVPGDESEAAIDSILRSSRDGGLREKAIFALSQHQSDRARQALRRFAADAGAPAELRAKAVFWIGQSSRRSGDDGAFLRQLYGKANDDDFRDAIIQAMAQSRSADAQRWLLDIATEKAGPLEARKKALFWAGQGGVPLAALASLYEKLRGEDEMQEQLIFVYSQRHEAAATDKLIDIARRDPNRELRKKAIFWLGQKDDPRVKDILLEIINRGTGD